MSAGYGNDNYNDNDSHDEGINSNDFATTWKIYLILFSKVGAEGGGLRADESLELHPNLRRRGLVVLNQVELI